MAITISTDNARLSIACALGASLAFSINDISVKSFSSSLPLHEVVLFRSMIGLIFTLAVFSGGRNLLSLFRTKNLMLQIVRGLFVVTANFTFFAGLAVLELAEASAIFFVAPLLITAFSALFLREYVGKYRWMALCVGMVGVLLVIKPGTISFQWALLLPVVSATAYAGLHTLTRVIGQRDSALTMSIYIQAIFIVVCALMGLAFGDGRFGQDAGPIMSFVFRAWVMPDVNDMLILLVAGICSATGGYLITQAYRSSAAGLVAPFEYTALLLAAFWGFVIWHEVPGGVSVMGMVLIIASGVFVALREAKLNRPASAKRAMGRR